MPDEKEYSEHFEDLLHSLRLMTTLGPPTDVVRKMLRTVQSADSVGAIVDPTAYRNALASGTLDRQKQVLDLYLRFKVELHKLFPDTGLLDELMNERM